MDRHYLAFALAHLARNRLYALVGIAGLAVGFAVAILTGLYVHHELSYDRFLPGHDRLYLAAQTLTPPAHGAPWRSYPARTDLAGLLKGDFEQIEATSRLAPAPVILQRGDVATSEDDFAWADPNIFDLLRLPAIAGDPTRALYSPDGLVLTRSMARKYFGEDKPLGRPLTVRSLNGGAGGEPEREGPSQVLTVAAVLEDPPPETHLKVRAFASALAPAVRAADLGPPAPFGQIAFTYVRLKPGASLEAVQAALPAFVARRIAQPPLMGSRLSLTLTPITALHLPEQHIDNPGAVNPAGNPTILKALVAVAALVLLTACVNFVGLATARGSRRAIEVGVRKAVGASRGDLFVQFNVETLMQVAAALVLAFSVCELAASPLGAFVRRPLSLDYSDPSTMVAILVVAAGAGLLAGAYPALLLSALRPASALKGGPQGAIGSAAVREGLVVAQFAVLVLLVVVIGTVYRQTAMALEQARRFGGAQVLWISEFGLCGGSFQDRLEALPGVRAVSCSAVTALNNGGAGSSAITRDGRRVAVDLGPMDVNFFDFYGLRPLAGRLFSRERGEDMALMRRGAVAWPSVIINQSTVRSLGFTSPDAAIGQSLRWSRLQWLPGQAAALVPPQPSPIVGVVPDYVMGASREPTRPMVYWIDPAFFGTISVKLDGAWTPQTLAALDEVWRDTGHVRPMRRRFLDQAVREAYADVLILGAAIAVATGLALTIACVGLFALSTFTAERRTREIGVRKAMGASSTDILRLLLWEFTKPVLVANLIAWPAGWLIMDWWLKGFAVHVDLPLWLFLAAGAGAVAIAWLTVGAHAWRTALERPVNALRYE